MVNNHIPMEMFKNILYSEIPEYWLKAGYLTKKIVRYSGLNSIKDGTHGEQCLLGAINS